MNVYVNGKVRLVSVAGVISFWDRHRWCLRTGCSGEYFDRWGEGERRVEPHDKGDQLEENYLTL